MNRKTVRRLPLAAVACSVLPLFFNLVMATQALAQPDTLEDGVERLAKKAASLPHERRMWLVWTNHAALSDERVDRLRAAFQAQLETAQARFAQGETAPALRVEITQTPSKIVFTALVPGDGGTSVVIEEVARMSAGIETNHGRRISLEKELLRRQEGKILSAVLAAPGDSGMKRLTVLTGEALEVYSGGPEDWKLEYAKPLPGPRPAERSLHGQLLVAEEAGGRMGILLPGRRCETSLQDHGAIACSSATVEWPSGRLLALPGCGKEPWWLISDSVDWTSDDRLLLRSAGAGKEQPFAAELRFPGPVVSIGAGDSAASATVVTRDLSSGNYEVYRIALVCGG